VAKKFFVVLVGLNKRKKDVIAIVNSGKPSLHRKQLPGPNFKNFSISIAYVMGE
jgi:hypothetical protein